jgi:hypothetical protein
MLATAMSTLPRMIARMLQLRPYEVELLRPARAVAPLSWALIGLGLLSLAWAVLACQPAWERRGQLAAEETRLQATLAGLAPQAAAGGTMGSRAASQRSAGKAREHDALSEGENIVAETRRPWHALFNQLEAAVEADGADVHIVQLNVDPRFATVQLVAEGRDLDKLVRFGERVAGNGPISSLTMTHHEWRDALGAHVAYASMHGELDDTPRPVNGASSSPATAAGGPSTSPPSPGASRGTGAGGGVSRARRPAP